MLKYYRDHKLIESKTKGTRTSGVIEFNQQVAGYPQRAYVKIYSNDRETAEREVLLSRKAHFVCKSTPKLYDFYTENESIILIYELLEEKSLQDLIGSREISIDQLISVFLKILQIFSLLNSSRIRHNSLKPTKILIKDNFTPIILDFSKGTDESTSYKIPPETSPESQLLGHFFLSLSPLFPSSDTLNSLISALILDNLQIETVLLMNSSHFQITTEEEKTSLPPTPPKKCQKCNLEGGLIPLECGHGIHEYCLEQQLKHSDMQCPVCSTEIQIELLDAVVFSSPSLNQLVSIRKMQTTSVICPSCSEQLECTVLSNKSYPMNVRCKSCSITFCSYCLYNNGHYFRCGAYAGYLKLN